MFSLVFWKATAERALKTLAQTMLALWLVGDKMFNLFDVDWRGALGVGLGAMLISVLTSMGSAGVGPAQSPSLVAEVPAGRHEAP